MIAWDESKAVDFGLGINIANDEYAKVHGGQRINDGGMTAVMSMRAWQDYVTGLDWETSKIKHLNEYRDEYKLPHVGEQAGPTPVPPGPFPQAPTRDQVGAVRIGFQGVTVSTQQYGTFPAFGPETTTLNDADLDAYCQQMVAKGWTHGEIAVSWQYDEPGFLMPVPGRDLTNDLPELVRRVTRMLANGLTSVVVFLAGDGRSRPKNPDGSYPYNDPVGHTYGYEWLMENLPRIIEAFRRAPAADLTRYVSFCPGYDAVFYGWGGDVDGIDRQPQRVMSFGRLFRSLCPGGYLAIEHDIGHIPIGEGPSDWTATGRMKDFDILLSEFPNWPTTGDPVWQIVGRFVKPYHRPPDQPASDDPNPPYYLGTSPRGRFFYVAYEYATFVWTRGHVTAEQVQQARDYYRALGVEYVC